MIKIDISPYYCKILLSAPKCWCDNDFTSKSNFKPKCESSTKLILNTSCVLKLYSKKNLEHTSIINPSYHSFKSRFTIWHGILNANITSQTHVDVTSQTTSNIPTQSQTSTSKFRFQLVHLNQRCWSLEDQLTTTKVWIKVLIIQLVKTNQASECNLLILLHPMGLIAHKFTINRHSNKLRVVHQH